MDWRQEAACRGMDPELWYPTRVQLHRLRQAQAVCAGCPVQRECAGAADGHGVWAGVDEDTRAGKGRLVLIGQNELARCLGQPDKTVGSWVKVWPWTRPGGVPVPYAVELADRGRRIPLWHADALPEWEAWVQARRPAGANPRGWAPGPVPAGRTPVAVYGITGLGRRYDRDHATVAGWVRRFSERTTNRVPRPVAWSSDRPLWTYAQLRYWDGWVQRRRAESTPAARGKLAA